MLRPWEWGRQNPRLFGEICLGLGDAAEAGTPPGHSRLTSAVTPNHFSAVLLWIAAIAIVVAAEMAW